MAVVTGGKKLEEEELVETVEAKGSVDEEDGVVEFDGGSTRRV